MESTGNCSGTGHITLHIIHGILGGLQAQSPGVVNHPFPYQDQGFFIQRIVRLIGKYGKSGRINATLIYSQQSPHFQRLDLLLVKHFHGESGILPHLPDFNG